MAETAAEAAYAAALDEIERVKREGGGELRFDAEPFRALDRIPLEVMEVRWLKLLVLNQTAVVDLAPVSALTGLESIFLSQTAVSDLLPLERLTALQNLNIGGSAVFDLAPIVGLTGLQVIVLNHTSVLDISPLARLRRLRSIHLDNTAVSDISPLSSLSALRSLYLGQTAVSDLSAVAGLTDLQWLDLGEAAVSDLAPLVRLSALTGLWLNGTKVSDLSPLRGLSTLQTLGLDQTSISDLSPLANLTQLIDLTLHGTNVADLRPIRRLEKLGANHPPGLVFTNTPATKLDAELAHLAEIEDVEDRARQTLAYLNTLPPWPEPYTPKARPDGLPPEPIGGAMEPAIPAPAPAPLQVVEAGGVLRHALPGDALDAEGSLLARQGWQALRDYLADLADLRPRIGNQMPTMDRALARFEAALGTDYDRANPVLLGTHGNRIMRLAGTAEDSLSAADAAELVEFAAAVALFLERFPVWRAYREEALARPLTAAEALAALQPIEELADELFDRPEIDPEIARSLKDQVAEVREQPGDTLASKGLVASTRNVLAKIAELAWRGVKGAGRATGSFGKLAVDETKKAAAKGLAGAALDILLNNARILLHLAETMPKEFGWIVTVLKALGVAIP